jgi:hypothetical protein
MATFRTDPNTGRTVISESNRVDRPSDPGDLYSDRNRARSRPDFLSRDEFETASGMTDTNPYGNEGFFSRVFGIDPSKISYANNLGPQGIENVKIQAYDRYLNPFAKFDAFDRPTMGADASLGLTRSGVQPGDMTIYGPAIQSQREGIAGLFENTMLGSLMPKQARIPGYDRNVLLPDLMAGPAVGGGTEPPGVPYFTSSTAPTRDAASVPESTFRPLFTTDPEERNLIEEDFVEANRRATDEDSPFSRPVPESTYRPLFTDDVTMADVIANAPMATAPVAGSVLVNARPTVTTPETENQRIMRERQEAFDAAMRRREAENKAFVERAGSRFDEIEQMGKRIDQRATGQGLPEQMDAFDQELLSRSLDLPMSDATAPFDLIATIPPPPMMTPTPKPSRGIDPRALSLAQELQRLARERATQ